MKSSRQYLMEKTQSTSWKLASCYLVILERPHEVWKTTDLDINLMCFHLATFMKIQGLKISLLNRFGYYYVDINFGKEQSSRLNCWLTSF